MWKSERKQAGNTILVMTELDRPSPMSCLVLYGDGLPKRTDVCPLASWEEGQARSCG